MNNLNYSQIRQYLDSADMANLPMLSISILRNITIEPIEPYLRYNAHKMGFNASIHYGAYDNIFKEAVGGSPELFSAETDCVLVFMYLENISWNLARNMASMDTEAVQRERGMILDQIEVIVRGIRRQSSAAILWHAFEDPIEPCFGILDSQTELGHLGTIRGLNSDLKKLLNRSDNAYFVDMNLCISRLGCNKYYDQRYWHINRAPYTREALCEIAHEDYKYLRPLKGKNKKCLVLDCDNVLWGGVIGEDGLAGIKLGKTYPGSSYYDFQQEVLNLFQRGVIIALCSKNNDGDIWEVFRNHPDMILKEEHIAASQINWDDKAINLRRLAAYLNIGLDSIVFVDDSDFEINLVRKELPEVDTIHLPTGQSIYSRQILASCGAFDALAISREDRNRGKMYQAEAKRKKALLQSSDMESYYRSLEMVAEVRFADDFSIPRIAQQTQKTNQFNLTTRRYTDTDIKQFVLDETVDVLYLKLLDHFGDSGIVGTCILRYEDQVAIIDSLLVSCRALGRSIEDVLLIQALKLAKKRGCLGVHGTFSPSPKNKMVEHYLSSKGFENQGDEFGGSRKYYFDLNRSFPKVPPYFKAVVSDI